MKLNIGGFEVSINAKGVYGKNFNKEDTMALLNLISIWAGEAAKHYEQECAGLGKSAQKEADNIYYLLRDNGAYDGIY